MTLLLDTNMYNRCGRKLSWESYSAAIVALIGTKERSLRKGQSGQDRLTHYFCEDCGCRHVGHLKMLKPAALAKPSAIRYAL